MSTVDVLDERLTVEGYLELKEDGFSDNEIAEEFWVNRHILIMWKKKHGLGKGGNRKVQLAKAVEKRRKYLIEQLCFYGHNESEIQHLTLSELEVLHIQVKCRIGREMSKIDAEG